MQQLKDVHGHLEEWAKRLAHQDGLLLWMTEELMSGDWHWYIAEDKENYSPKFCQVLGYDELAPVPESWKKLIKPESKERALKAFNEHVNSRGKIPYDIVVEYTHRDGSTVRLRCAGCVYLWDGDEPIRMFGVHLKG